ncbi:mannose-1-phosphate guanylyltransferase/mannose-6-phosphate isomerase, partial [Pseudomonadales bacterium]|nr:mannose-1-phosphate guanylyltransferase/mannose-6-phosphate isomerase [Pseudomonadales bacterium]
MLLPVIMAGGSGTRLWPLSRALYPKQFLPLASDKTMLQETVLRLSSLETAPPVTICNEEHRFTVAEQLNNIDKLGPIILEPEGRNTAPAVALAALVALGQNDPLLLVLAADHVIRDDRAFTDAIKKAIPLACQGKLVTFGIVPQSAQTGYGYIERGKSVSSGFEVNKFVEKPNNETAQGYIDSKDYYWNSGMFLFRASRYLKELKRHRPDMAAACKASLDGKTTDLDFIRLNNDEFLKCPEDSIDYAVMEKTRDAVVVPLDAGWSDIGSWTALWDVTEKDRNGNAIRGDVINEATKNCLVYGGERLITTLGLEDIIIVDTKDAVMVAHKDKVQDVKDIVKRLKVDARSEFELHREVYRPWGKYDLIDKGERYQVKRITVKPGAKLSVQMHRYRAEHWIVVSGTAEVTNGDKIFLLAENESTYIPVGVVHALKNPSKIPLELIEVQSGSYLGEDDI